MGLAAAAWAARFSTRCSAALLNGQLRCDTALLCAINSPNKAASGAGWSHTRSHLPRARMLPDAPLRCHRLHNPQSPGTPQARGKQAGAAGAQAQQQYHQQQALAAHSQQQQQRQQERQQEKQQPHGQQQQAPRSTAQQGPKYSSVDEFTNRVEIYRGRHSVVWNVVCKATKRALILKAYVKVGVLRYGRMLAPVPSDACMPPCKEGMRRACLPCVPRSALGACPAVPGARTHAMRRLPYPGSPRPSGQDDRAQLPPGPAGDQADAPDQLQGRGRHPRQL